MLAQLLIFSRSHCNTFGALFKNCTGSIRFWMLFCWGFAGSGSVAISRSLILYQTALTSDRLCLKKNISHRRLKRYLAGYCRERKRAKVHLHILFSRDSLPRRSLGRRRACPVEAQSSPIAAYWKTRSWLNQLKVEQFGEDGCHVLFVSNTKYLRQRTITD
jgi:hypothetical protein